MSVDYWLGVVTLPALAALAYGSVFAYLWVEMMAERKLGVTWEFKSRRSLGSISDYVIRRNIWWERPWGPVFTGHWYRENNGRRATRWLGIGSVNGPCFMVFHSRDLGDE